jgi:hypothetical protein
LRQKHLRREHSMGKTCREHFVERTCAENIVSETHAENIVSETLAENIASETVAPRTLRQKHLRGDHCVGITCLQISAWPETGQKHLQRTLHVRNTCAENIVSETLAANNAWETLAQRTLREALP